MRSGGQPHNSDWYVYPSFVSPSGANYTLVLVYMEHCCPRRAAPFLSYYVFTAAIMHVSTRECFRGVACIPYILNILL